MAASVSLHSSFVFRTKVSRLRSCGVSRESWKIVFILVPFQTFFFSSHKKAPKNNSAFLLPLAFSLSSPNSFLSFILNNNKKDSLHRNVQSENIFQIKRRLHDLKTLVFFSKWPKLFCPNVIFRRFLSPRRKKEEMFRTDFFFSRSSSRSGNGFFRSFCCRCHLLKLL